LKIPEAADRAVQEAEVLVEVPTDDRRRRDVDTSAPLLRAVLSSLRPVSTLSARRVRLLVMPTCAACRFNALDIHELATRLTARLSLERWRHSICCAF
jgi:hypothetical protein